MLTLIEHGQVFAPRPLGRRSVVLAGGSILTIGEIDRAALRAVGIPYRVVDASGCLVVPGFIDPHQHLIGAGGEQGFASRMPEVPLQAIVEAGITTAVGCLGTDTSARHLSALLARARQLREQGISTYMYTGGFPVPPPTMTGSVADDLVLIDLIVGLGEVAVADFRSTEPTLHELARFVSQAIMGGLLAGKAGITHFHIGPGGERLALLHRLTAEHEIPARYLYPTHITRSEDLLEDAIRLSRKGAFVDIDTVEDGAERWVGTYLERGGELSQLTLSSDAHTPGGAPERVLRAFQAIVRSGLLPIHDALCLVTANPARALSLSAKGRLEPGLDADLVVLAEDSLEPAHVFARSVQVLERGRYLPPDERVTRASNQSIGGEEQ